MAAQIPTVLHDWLSLHIQCNDKEWQYFLRNLDFKKTLLLLSTVFNRISLRIATDLIAIKAYKTSATERFGL